MKCIRTKLHSLSISSLEHSMNVGQCILRSWMICTKVLRHHVQTNRKSLPKCQPEKRNQHHLQIGHNKVINLNIFFPLCHFVHGKESSLRLFLSLCSYFIRVYSFAKENHFVSCYFLDLFSIWLAKTSSERWKNFNEFNFQRQCDIKSTCNTIFSIWYGNPQACLLQHLVKSWCFNFGQFSLSKIPGKTADSDNKCQ